MAPAPPHGDPGSDGRQASGGRLAVVTVLAAADVVFTAEILANPETAATTINGYRLVERVEALDPHTFRLTFKEPTGGWYVPFVGTGGMILPRHALEAYSDPAYDRPSAVAGCRVTASSVPGCSGCSIAGSGTISFQWRRAANKRNPKPTRAAMSVA